MFWIFKRLSIFNPTPKLRVRELIKGNGTSLFFPQRRKFFIWRDMYEVLRDKKIKHYQKFSTLYEANEYLAEIMASYRARIIKKQKIHIYNEVFEKLKNG